MDFEIKAKMILLNSNRSAVEILYA